MSKVVTGKVRFSYANVWQAKSINGSEEKYSVSLIIPKSDVKTIEEIQVAMEEAKQEGIAKFVGKIPANLKLPLRDGDVDKPDDEAYKNSYFINANSKLVLNGNKFYYLVDIIEGSEWVGILFK